MAEVARAIQKKTHPIMDSDESEDDENFGFDQENDTSNSSAKNKPISQPKPPKSTLSKLPRLPFADDDDDDDDEDDDLLASLTKSRVKPSNRQEHSLETKNQTAQDNSEVTIRKSSSNDVPSTKSNPSKVEILSFSLVLINTT